MLCVFPNAVAKLWLVANECLLVRTLNELVSFVLINVMLHYILAQVSIHYIQKKRLAFRALVMSARLLFHEVPRLFILNIGVSCSVFTFACSQQQQQRNQLLFALLGAVRSD